MDNNTLKRRLARFTRSIRVSLGLIPRGGKGPAGLPFRRETPIGQGTKSRVDALEIDFERMVRGWDQHVPQLLAAIAEVRADVFAATEMQARLQRLEEIVARLEANVGDSVDSPPENGHARARQG